MKRSGEKPGRPQPTHMRVPKSAERLLEWIAPGQDGQTLAGDLNEEYSRYVHPDRGLWRARLWYWRQALLSIPPILRRRLQRRRLQHSPEPIVTPSKGNHMESLASDLRFALRGLSRRPGVSAVILLTLALGIGATTAVFSVVQGVLIRPLPFDRPEDLVRIAPEGLFPLSKTDALYLYHNTRSLEVSAWGRGLFLVTGASQEPEELRGARVFANHFSVLGAQPLIGRGFLPEEGFPGSDRVVILAYGLWQRRFGGDPGVVGGRIDLSGIEFEVVGVMGPEHQRMEEDWQLWVPLDYDSSRQSHSPVAANARLSPGATLETAQAELQRVLLRSWRERGYEPSSPDAIQHYRLLPLKDWLLGENSNRLKMMMGAVALVLLTACANIANLLLAAGRSRGHEIGMRITLGAGRLRIVRQMLTESLLLGLLGGGAGVLLAWLLLQVGLIHLPADLPRAQNIALDGGVLLFAALSSLLASMIFGVVPALRASTGGDASTVWREGARTATLSPTRQRPHQVLVAVEVAMTILLVIGAGLLLRSFWAVRSVDPGFDPSNVAVLRATPPRARYSSAESLNAYFERAAERLRAHPGVASVGLIQFLPMTPGGYWDRYERPDRPSPAASEAPRTAVRIVTPDYFASMRIPVLNGRTFQGNDRPDSELVALINQTLAQQSWPDEDPVGRQILFSPEDPVRLRIVGVVGDVRQSDPRTPPHPELYRPLSQQPWNRMYFTVRVDRDAAGKLAGLRQALRSEDPEVTLSQGAELTGILGLKIQDSRFLAALLAGFAGVCLLLGAIGIYGVSAYSVSQRRREFAVRLALGAGRRTVLSSSLANGLAPVALGGVLGLAGGLAFSRVMGSALFEVSATDPVTFLAAPALLLLTALLALYLPARRASLLDPAKILRDE